MLTSMDINFIFNSTCLSACLGDKGLFGHANILQTLIVVNLSSRSMFLVNILSILLLLKQVTCSAILKSPGLC